MADWSELPLDLLNLIANLSNINSSNNTRHFRSVCSYWRSSIPPKPSNYFTPRTIKFLTPQGLELEFRLVKQTIFLLSPINDPNSCWVVKLEEHKQGVFHLLSPFSKITSTKEFQCDVLDLTNINTLELGHEYVLRNVCGDNNINDHTSFNDMENEKVAVIFEGKNDNFTLLSTHSSTGKLFMYWSNTQNWGFLDHLALGYDDRGEYTYDWSLRYVDVVEFEGAFYAITNAGRIVVIESRSEDNFVTVNLMKKSIIGGDKKCLVKSNEDLLLVDLYTCPIKGSFDVNAIDVYKLDKEDKKWVLLTSLGGCTIFLSNNSSFSASNLHGLKENCIYFSFTNIGKYIIEKKNGDIDYIEDYYNEDEVESKEIGVFDYDKGNFRSCEGQFEGLKFFCLPPPSWVNLLL